MAECCAESGYEAVTIEAVTERAGLDRVSFDRHFESVEDCAVAALNWFVSETMTAVATADPSEDAAEQRMLQITAILGLIDARPGFARLAYVEARQGGSARLHDGYKAAAHILALMMERGNEGEAEIPVSAGRAALGGAEAVVRRELITKDDGQLCRYLPDFVYAALVPFVGQGEALRQSRAAAKLLAKEE